MLAFCLVNDVHDMVSDLKQISLQNVYSILCNLLSALRCLWFFVEFADIQSEVLLFVFNQLQLESSCILFDLLVWCKQVLIHLLIFISSVFFLFKYFAVVLVTVRHLLDFFLNFSEFCLFVFDVNITLLYVFFELGVCVYEFVFQINHFAHIRRHSFS
jgi:hypothetical protein